ncbi:MAG TPA: DnaJ family domain-containing protein [Anaerolineales bacterium]|nr:DnaJ family domain-containing protein [Anaerolineales bacterium]
MPNIEDLLRRAMEEGKFDNLPGKGKPLHLGESNPHANPDWEVAYGIIKEAGFSLPWIETIRDIEREIEEARYNLRLAYETYLYSVQQSHTAVYTAPEWERAKQAFKEKLPELNKRIRDYNLEVPNARFQRPVLNFEAEVKKVTS